MTWLYLVLLVISATFSTIFHSAWKRKLERPTALNFFLVAISCGSNGSLFLVLGLAIKQNRQLPVLPVLTSVCLFSASLLEYVSALTAIVRSIRTLRHHTRAQDL